MSRCTRILLLAASSLAIAMPVNVATAQDVDGVRITIDPTTSQVVLGESLGLAITVSNDGRAPTGPLVVHIDITDPNQSSSVDPEDWTSTLSKPIGSIAPGAIATVAWTIQPISGGTFAVYAVALAPGVDSAAVSNVTEVSVADQRSLNPGGILPVALGAPAVVGALLLVQLRASRRYGR